MIFLFTLRIVWFTVTPFVCFNIFFKELIEFKEFSLFNTHRLQIT